MTTRLTDDLGICVEARITALAVSNDGKEVTVTMSKAGGMFMLVLHGVDRFVANEFRQQNVVDRVLLRDANCDLASIHESLGVLVAGSDKPSNWEAYSEAIKHETESILSGYRIIVEIEAIYGVSVIALVTAYSIVDV